MQATPTSNVGVLNSVFAKCLAIVAVTAIVLVITMSYNSYRKSVSITTDLVFDMAVGSTTAAAAGLADPIATNRIDRATQLIDSLRNHSSGLTDVALVLGGDGALIYQTPNMSADDVAAMTRIANESLRSGQPSFVRETLDIGAPIRDSSGTLIGTLVVDWSSATLVASIRSETIKNLGLAMGLLIGALILAYVLLQHFLGRPLVSIQEAVRRVSGGDYTAEVAGRDSADELGRLAQSLDVMRVSLAEGKARRDAAAEKEKDQAQLIRTLSQSFRALVQGDLTADVTTPVAAEFQDLVSDYNDATRAVHDTMAQVVTLAERISQDSTDLGSYANDLSGRTENQAATLEETAAALDALTGGVRNAANSTREVEGIVQKARTEAKQSGEVVQKTISAMSEISDSSNQISAIIAVIDDIAFQTNLLALNAGVEAARAGEAGRGFAVVASEVRALAQRSSEAAHEIKTLISGSSEHVANGVTLVAQAGDALKAITERVVQIATLMSDMANNAQEQAASLDEINVGVGQLDQVTQRNASMVEESTTATKSLAAQSQTLSVLVSRFTLKKATATAPLKLDKRVA